MVFLLAKVVQSAFTEPVKALGIQQEIEEWYLSKPDSFDPVQSAPQGLGPDHRFPSIWLLLSVHGEL